MNISVKVLNVSPKIVDLSLNILVISLIIAAVSLSNANFRLIQMLKKAIFSAITAKKMLLDALRPSLMSCAGTTSNQHDGLQVCCFSIKMKKAPNQALQRTRGPRPLQRGGFQVPPSRPASAEGRR